MTDFVLITPARNEGRVIGKTIISVLGQSRRPIRWIIVDDGSTDNTASIVRQYANVHDFIVLVEADAAKSSLKRHFARKVHAFNRGLREIGNLPHAFIGNLDADIVLPNDYYERILDEFSKDDRLGIAGGLLFTQAGNRVVCDDTSLDSVGGAIQLFRRQCFEEIGGYYPLETGGIDTAAEVSARMRGWKVCKFPAVSAHEQRPTGSVGQSSTRARFKEGIRCQALGYGTLFYLARCAYKCTSNRPFILGSIVSMAGFTWGKVSRHQVRLPDETVKFLRTEQLHKLKRLAKLDTSFLIR